MALVYHRVADPARYPFLERGGTPVIHPVQLSREIRFLQEQGARFLTFADLGNGLFPGRGEFGVILSFDDGFRDNYITGLDVLSRHGVKGVLFQSSGMVDAGELVPEHALYWYADRPETSRQLRLLAVQAGWPGAGEVQPSALSRIVGQWVQQVSPDSLREAIEQLRATSRAEESALALELYPEAAHLQQAVQGGHEIGSHGHRHLPRSVLHADEFEKELSHSHDLLSDITRTDVKCFSYPFNSYLTGDEVICARHYAQVATVDNRLIEPGSDPLSLGRYSWPGHPRNGLRQRRWLMTGRI